MDIACTTYWREKRVAYRVLVGKCEGKRPLGKPSVGGRTVLKLAFKK